MCLRVPGEATAKTTIPGARAYAQATLVANDACNRVPMVSVQSGFLALAPFHPSLGRFGALAQARLICIQIYAFAILASMGCRKSCSSLT